MSECLLQWSLVSNGDNSELLLLFWLSVCLVCALHCVGVSGVFISFNGFLSPTVEETRRGTENGGTGTEYISWKMHLCHTL